MFAFYDSYGRIVNKVSKARGGNMAQTENIIEVEGLEKAYGTVRAVQGISFAVERGSLFSFLGVNGAGKSTTINILCSILHKDAGNVRVCGFDLDKDAQKIKSRVGVVFQTTVLDELLTVRDNLTIRASYYGLRGKKWRERLDELTELLDLKEILPRPFGKLSGGQKRRADIARGLINRPELLVLDEPTTGLDPQTRRMVWKTVQKLRSEQNMTVFLTTHYMEEADGSDRVVILDGGKIVANDSPVQLKNEYSRNYLYLYGDAGFLSEALTKRGENFEETAGGVRLMMQSAENARDFLGKYPELCKDFEFMKGDMDDVFLAVTGKKLMSGGAL